MMDSPDILFNPTLQKKMAKVVLAVNEEIALKIGINPFARATCIKPAGCQRGDTMLSTGCGLLSLEELGNKQGDTWQLLDISVLSGVSDTQKASKFFVNGFAATKKITMESGVEFECTPNHKYRVLRSGKS